MSSGIPAGYLLSPGDRLEDVVAGAGAVVWRADGAGTLMVALVRRRKRGDWGLPKGKLNPGESSRQACLREVREETGLRCRARRPVATVFYRSSRGRSRLITYWLAQPYKGRPRPDHEVSEFRWLPVGTAMAQLSEAREVAVLEVFRRSIRSRADRLPA